MKFILIFLMATVSPFSLNQKADDVKNIHTKNGMQIFVLEDHSIPNVAMYLFLQSWFHANEYLAYTGISHFFEIWCSNGAKKYGPKQFDVTMEANGGSNNAGTSKI